MRIHVIPFFAFAVAISLPAFGSPQFSESLTSNTTNAIEYISLVLSNKVAEITLENLTLASARPDTNVTESIRFVDVLGQELLETEGDSESILVLNENIVAVIDALKERRIYKYQLWAEGRLEQVSAQLEKGRLSAPDLIKLYLSLGEINVSYISENMLNREIMATMALIYDRLDSENKKQVRRFSVQQQADPFSKISNLQRRRTLDEF